MYLNFLKHYQSKAILFFLLAIYLLFPLKSSFADGYCFAFQIKSGDELFLSHHLLYNFLGFLWVRIINLFGDFDVLASLKVLNSIIAVLSLFVLDLIMKGQKISDKKRALWLLLVGSCWGIMRFATENETYLAPILFSLLGSYYLGKFISVSKTRFLFYSGCFMALAALFHQIHFFWWLAVLIGLVYYKQPIKNMMIYFLPALSVPLIYMFVIAFYYDNTLTIQSFFEFIFHDYVVGSASFEPHSLSLTLTPVSFVRTFIQVHGYFMHLVYIDLGYVLWGGFSFVVFLLAAYHAFKVRIRKALFSGFFIGVHTLAFILQLLFAFFSHGNAEFMVMLPFLIAIVMSAISINEEKFLGFFAVGLFIWNFSLGLYPLNKYVVDDNAFVVSNYIKSVHENKENSFYIVYNRPETSNTVEYITGQGTRGNMAGLSNLLKKDLSHFIDSLHSQDINIYTNCINRPATLSRAHIVLGDQTSYFSNCYLLKVDSVETLSGKYFLYKVLPDSNQ